LVVSISVAVAAMRSAFAGSTPCQPKGLTPTNSRGRNIISMATRLVT